MFELYREVISQYKKLPLKQERQLIGLAQKGIVEAQSKLLLHLIGFFEIRIKTTAFPSLIQLYGEDLMQECVILAAEKIKTYNLEYRSKSGKLQPLHLSTYIWKSITGLIYAYRKNRKEICFSDVSLIS